MRRRQFVMQVFLFTLLCACALVQVTAQAGEETLGFDTHDPATGYWVGRVDLPKMAPFVALEITKDETGGYSARLFLLELGSFNAECEQIDVDGSSVTVLKKLVRKPMRLTGVVSDDGQMLSGAVEMVAGEDEVKDADGPKVFTLHRSLKAATLPTAQAFSGHLTVPGMGKLAMTLVFAKTPGGNWVGSADVPVQAILGMPLTDVSETDGTLRATMPILANPAVIEAKIDAEQDRLVGRFKQAMFDLELNFARDPGYVSPTLARPQHPRKPYAYETEDLIAPTPAGFSLAGTLTIPRGASPSDPVPCAVLISGSGQQDRDETLLGHKPFLVIADRLTRAGLAVFRYDDRGVGESGGRDEVESATSKDFADDAAAVVEFLKTQPRIDSTKIGLIGHSEGGLIAPMVATARDDIAFIVLLAGPGVSGRDILELQGRLLLKAEGQSEKEIEEFSARQTKLLDLVISGATSEEITKAYEAMEDEREDGEPANGDVSKGGSEDEEAAMKQQVLAQLAALNSPWMKFFLAYDPRPTLAKVKCPVLAVNGTLDLQVWHEQNLPEIAKTLQDVNADVTIKRYENLNHLFQPAKTGGISEYAASEVTFDDAVLEDVIQWIKLKLAASAH